MAIDDVIKAMELIGSGVTIGGLLVHVYDNKLQHWLIDRNFWNIFDLAKNEKIILVMPTAETFTSKSPLDPNTITTIEDSMAMSSIISAFLDHGIEPKIKVHTEITEQDKEEHLILICGPVGNKITKELFTTRTMRFPFRFFYNGKSWEIKDENGDVVHPEKNSTKDYAIMAKLSNPWSHEHPKKIYLAAGIEGLGTWGAGCYLSKKVTGITKELKWRRASERSNFMSVVSVNRPLNRRPNPVLTEHFEVL